MQALFWFSWDRRGKIGFGERERMIAVALVGDLWVRRQLAGWRFSGFYHIHRNAENAFFQVRSCSTIDLSILGPVGHLQVDFGFEHVLTAFQNIKHPSNQHRSIETENPIPIFKPVKSAEKRPRNFIARISLISISGENKFKMARKIEEREKRAFWDMARDWNEDPVWEGAISCMELSQRFYQTGEKKEEQQVGKQRQKARENGWDRDQDGSE